MREIAASAATRDVSSSAGVAALPAWIRASNATAASCWNLLERREVADRRVEAIEGRELFLRSTAWVVEGTLQRQDMALQFVELRRPEGAELVVGFECVANQRRLAIRGGDPRLHRRFQAVEIVGDDTEDEPDLYQLIRGQPLARQFGQLTPGRLHFSVEQRSSRPEVLGICGAKQRGSGRDDALGTLRQLQARDCRRNRLLSNLPERLADGVEGVIPDHRGDHGKAADGDERQQQPFAQAMPDLHAF